MVKVNNTQHLMNPSGFRQQPTFIDKPINLTKPTDFKKLTESLTIGNVDFESGTYSASRQESLIAMVEKKETLWLVWPVKGDEIQASIGCRDLQHAKDFIERFVY